MAWSSSEGATPTLKHVGAGTTPIVSTAADATKSYLIYRDVWSSLAAASQCGEVFERDGLWIATAGGKWAVMNTVFLSRAVESEADLRDRISFAKSYFDANKRLWLFVSFNSWLCPSIEPEQLFWEHRVAHMHGCFGMQATRLLEPRRLPPELAYRLVDNDAERLAFSDINADSYGFPEEWRSDVAAWISQWPPSKARLYVGYFGDSPVTSAMVYLTGKVAYLGFLATRRGFEGKGYAEAISRYALARAKEHWDFRESILHSTPAGLSLYRRMGYSRVASFGIYLGGYYYQE